MEAGGFGGTIRRMVLLLAWENQGNPMRTFIQDARSPGVVIIIFFNIIMCYLSLCAGFVIGHCAFGWTHT